MTPEEEIAYWRELALAYERELKALRERVLRFLESRSAEALLESASADASWMSEIDRIKKSGDLQSTDVARALEDLWSRVERP